MGRRQLRQDGGDSRAARGALPELPDARAAHGASGQRRAPNGGEPGSLVGFGRTSRADGLSVAGGAPPDLLGAVRCA